MEDLSRIVNDFRQFCNNTDFHKVHKFVKYLDNNNYTRQRCVALCRQNYQIQFSMYTAVRKAAEVGSVEAVDTLISRGFPFEGDWDSVDSPMRAACKNGHLEVVKSLVEKHEVQVNRCKKHDFPLLSAMESKHNTYSIVEYLLQAGAPVNATNSRGVSPLIFAAGHNTAEVCQLLISNGADVNIQDKFEICPFFNALMNNRTDTIECLLDAGVDVNCRDWHGNTAFHTAAAIENIPLMKLLFSRGADPNLMTEQGNTAIHVSAFDGAFDVAKFLTVDVGVSLNVTNRHSNTPFLVAVGEGNIDIADMLIKAGYTPLPEEVDFDESDLILLRDGMSELISNWKKCVVNPRSLQDLSIFCIRHSMRGRVYTSVTLLPIPTKLKDDILMI